MFHNSSITLALNSFKRTLNYSLKEKYNIEDEQITDSFLKIHGLHPDNFDFISNIEKLISGHTNDFSIDDNSNKSDSDKNIESIQSETSAPIKKIIGYRYLYRKLNELFGKKEAKKITGELYDLSLMIHDSTHILKPYSYYEHTPLYIRINGKEQYLTIEHLFNKYKKFMKSNDYMDFINISEIKIPVLFHRSYMKDKEIKTNPHLYNDNDNLNIYESLEIDIWDDTNGFVPITKLIRHKHDIEKDFIIYQTQQGDFAFVTEDHPIIMADASEKQACDIKEGDLILDANQDVPNNTNEYIDIPEKLAYFLGFIIGDGNYIGGEIHPDYIDNPVGAVKLTRGNNLISVYQKDIENSHIYKITQELFPDANIFKFDEGDICNSKNINFSSWYLTTLLTGYFGFTYKENSFSKTLPKNFLNWKHNSKSALIAGLIDSDGTVFKQDGRCDIRLKSYAVINVLFDALKLVGAKGIKKRILGKNIEQLMFGVAFKANESIYSWSEKLKLVDRDIALSYDVRMSNKLPNPNMIKKIFRFNSKEVKTTTFLKDDLQYVYDITTQTGRFVANGMVQHNCWALDSSSLIYEGRNFGQLHSKPCKWIGSYISGLCETIHQMSNHLAGAIAVGTIFIDMAKLLIYSENISYEQICQDAKIIKYIENELQKFVHSVNHLSRNSSECPFTNVSLFDRTKLNTILDDKSWLFDNWEKQSKEYIIEYIIRLQEIFLNFFNKGDDTKNGMPYRFPVVTVNLSINENKTIQDQKYFHDICKRDIFRYNIYASEGNKIASCCRLSSDTELLELGNQVNSFGGAGLSLGSLRVVTINFNRIALEAKSREHFYEIVDERILSSVKILKAHKELIQDMTDKGLQPFVSMGWIQMKKLFSTLGIIGLLECKETLEQKFGENGDVIEVVLKHMNDWLKDYSKEYGIILNIEQIPGESGAIRLSKADKLIFGEEAVPYVLYSNQFASLWKDYTLWERLESYGKYNKLVTGGGIAHAQIGENITTKQAEQIIRYAIRVGCEHFALNSVYAQCEKGHVNFGKLKVCPVCESKIIDYMTRVVGFFTKVSDWKQERREWDFEHRKFIEIENK